LTPPRLRKPARRLFGSGRRPFREVYRRDPAFNFRHLELQSLRMLRTQLFADPAGRFVHDLILQSCQQNAGKTALVDTSCDRRFTFAEYGSLLESLAHGFISAGLAPGEVVAIFLPNSWEFAIAYHAATLAGGIPTLLNPSYREREIRYQLENSGAAFLISDAPLLENVNLSGLPSLRRVFTTRSSSTHGGSTGCEDFASLLRPVFGKTSAKFPDARQGSQQTIAALPYSSGTTGLPKGVMLSHYNLVANVYQILGPNAAPLSPNDVMLCFLPLYHIYGLTVALTLSLALGSTLVLMPRFDVQKLCALLLQEGVTMMPVVPPAINAFCPAAEAGIFPVNHKIRWVKCGAAPLAPELARRFTGLTGILVNQGYGMTEASPVTHVGFITPPEMYRPASIGQPLALTECRVMDMTKSADGIEVAPGEPGELVMRGPQFMLGYWKEPQATAAVLRDGWYFSGDIVRCDADGFYYVLDRSKEMIKYKGFPVAPAEVESVLLEHPAVRDCGVVAKPDLAAGEIPCAFVVLREGFVASDALRKELCGFVADRLARHKQPREIHFVEAVPRTPSGKILRRELRKTLV
jgi:long-chain acyl-CoA synthetase